MKKLMEQSTRAIGKIGLKLQKRSPELLMIGGTIGLAASFVLVCRATLKASKVLDNAKKQMEETEKALEVSEEYSEADKKQDERIISVQTGVKLVGLYTLPVLLAALSVSCMFGSHVVLKKRNASLAAAYIVADRGLKEYRANVVERFGKDVDQELRFGVKEEAVEEITVGEGGIEVTDQKTVKKVCFEPDALRRCFREGCLGWSNDPEANHMFLVKQMQFANDKLQKEGHLFLNDVYTIFGYPKTKEGQVLGWIYDKMQSRENNYIDFGIYDNNDRRKMAFVNGYEATIWLDFNAEYILDKI